MPEAKIVRLPDAGFHWHYEVTYLGQTGEVYAAEGHVEDAIADMIAELESFASRSPRVSA